MIEIIFPEKSQDFNMHSTQAFEDESHLKEWLECVSAYINYMILNNELKFTWPDGEKCSVNF